MLPEGPAALPPSPVPCVLHAGILRYQDTSHGEIVAQHPTQMGPCSVMRQNPYNAVMCLGHSRVRAGEAGRCGGCTRADSLFCWFVAGA